MPEQWLSIAEAAAIMRIHPRTVERRAAAGKIESRRNDDGQVQVRINVPDPEPPPTEPISVEAFETVKEMADRQVDIAAGSASALVRAAQEQAMRAENQANLARHESDRYRRETQVALVLVAVVVLVVMVAVGYGTSTITAARDEARSARERAMIAEQKVQSAAEVADQARQQTAAALIAKALAEGKVNALESHADAVIRQAARPSTQPSLIERLTHYLGQ